MNRKSRNIRKSRLTLLDESDAYCCRFPVNLKNTSDEQIVNELRDSLKIGRQLYPNQNVVVEVCVGRSLDNNVPSCDLPNQT